MSTLNTSLKSLTPEALAVLDCVLEGIMIADAACFIRYINPAYTQMTGRRTKQEVGRQLKPEAPFGPLRQAIITGKPVFGSRYRPKGSKAELIVNAAPLIIDGQVKGGVSFCQDITDIIVLTKKLSERSQLVESLTEKLEGLCSARYTFEHLVGESPELLQTVEMAKRAATSPSTVLLVGESGTGKELFAHAIHNASLRFRKPFLKINCAAIPENLLESEFFGYEKGAFTGAGTRKMGLFERADGGTVFLDEIGDMGFSLQTKILRVLQDGEITRLSGWRPIRVDVRVIAATNRNLERMVEEGKFRQELYYRVNVMKIAIPPLHQRRQDVPLLVDHILRRLNSKLRKQIKGVDHAAMQSLLAYSWPGNIRELENTLERAVNLFDGDLIPVDYLILPENSVNMQGAEGSPREESADFYKEIQPLPCLAEQEDKLIQRALALYGTSVKGKRQAAQALGISLATLYKRLQNRNKCN